MVWNGGNKGIITEVAGSSLHAASCAWYRHFNAYFSNTWVELGWHVCTPILFRGSLAFLLVGFFIFF